MYFILFFCFTLVASLEHSLFETKLRPMNILENFKAQACEADSSCSLKGCLKDKKCECFITKDGDEKTNVYSGSNCATLTIYTKLPGETFQRFYVQQTYKDGKWVNDTTFTNREVGEIIKGALQNVECYCKRAENSTKDEPCLKRCMNSKTCNSKGTCDSTGGCNCIDQTGGTWCERCKLGWKSSDATNGKLCDICVENWFPKKAENKLNMCTTYCADNDPEWGCGGHGKCNENGTCKCESQFAGDYCTRCNYPYVYGVYPMCKECYRETTCSNAGKCLPDGTCQCDPGRKGEKCQNCTLENDNLPSCNNSVAAAIKASSAGSSSSGASDTCSKGGFPWLIILLAILATLLICGLAFAAFMAFSKMRSAKPSPGPSGNWTEFAADDDKAAYSRL